MNIWGERFKEKQLGDYTRYITNGNTLISNMVQNVLIGANLDIHFSYLQKEKKPQNKIPEPTLLIWPYPIIQMQCVVHE